MLVGWLSAAALSFAANAPATDSSGATATIDAPTRIDDELRIEPIADSVYVIVHERPWAANSLLVEMTDGTLVLCDTPYDDVATKHLVAWLREKFGKRPIVAINGHFHADAMGGNGALRAARIATYGSDLTARMLKERGAKLHAQLLEYLDDEELRRRFEMVEWLPPEHQFVAAEGLELQFGTEKVVLYYPGPGHSPDNIVTWFPSRRLLFGGCLVRTKPRLPNVADAALEAYPRTIENLRRFDAETIVPGHGRFGGPELLEITLEAVASHKAKAAAGDR